MRSHDGLTERTVAKRRLGHKAGAGAQAFQRFVTHVLHHRRGLVGAGEIVEARRHAPAAPADTLGDVGELAFVLRELMQVEACRPAIDPRSTMELTSGSAS